MSDTTGSQTTTTTDQATNTTDATQDSTTQVETATTTETGTKKVVLSDKAYSTLKWVALVALPALATLYAAIAAIWGIPGADKVVGTITAVDTLLGTLLGISTVQYNNSGANADGALIIDQSQTGAAKYSLEFNDPLVTYEGNKSLTLKVQTK